MDEYIKREDALKAVTYVGPAELTDIIPLTLLTAQKNIRNIPTADVAPKSEIVEFIDRLDNALAKILSTENEVLVLAIKEKNEETKLIHTGSMIAIRTTRLCLSELRKQYAPFKNVTAESAIAAIQEAARECKDAPLDAFFDLNVGPTMHL